MASGGGEMAVFVLYAGGKIGAVRDIPAVRAGNIPEIVFNATLTYSIIFSERKDYTMQYKHCSSITRFICVLLLAATVLSGISLTSQKAYAAVHPQKVVDAVDKFTTAIGRFSANDASANIGKIADFCNRLGGLTSVASGVIGILQMAGVIQDPTLVMIGKVLDAIKDVQTTLDNMNQTLNRIAQDLINIQVVQEEKDRNNKATTMSTNWNNFNTNYTEKLQTYVSEYEAKINTGIRDWWMQDAHEGVYVLMTKNYNEENSLTYSKKKYSEGLPATSDIKYVVLSNDVAVTIEETVNVDWSIGVPADCMPDTSSTAFNIDTYREDFKKLMVSALDEAIKNNKLPSGCGAAVKSEYNTSAKQSMLDIYADNILNTVIYKIACDVMTNNNSWVAQVISTYTQYCNNVLQRDSGINAFLNYIYLTHAFEGEVSKDIDKFLDCMIAQAGIYGSFALTCAGQDSLQTTAAKEQLQEYFTNTVESLDAKRKEALTGYDNYCYVTGTVLSADYLDITSKIYIHRSAILKPVIKPYWKTVYEVVGFT